MLHSTREMEYSTAGWACWMHCDVSNQALPQHSVHRVETDVSQTLVFVKALDRIGGHMRGRRERRKGYREGKEGDGGGEKGKEKEGGGRRK